MTLLLFRTAAMIPGQPNILPSDSDWSMCTAINRSMGCWRFSYPENILGLLFPKSLIKKNPVWEPHLLFCMVSTHGCFPTVFSTHLQESWINHTEFLCISSVTFLFLLTSIWKIFVWLFLCCPSSSHFHFRESYYEHCFNLWLCCYWCSLAS